MNKENLPFKQITVKDGVIRTFKESTNNEEFKWHIDNEDRIVKTLHKTNWMIQIDNELPMIFEENTEYFIPKGIYHRIIKGSGDLEVSVKFV